MAEEIAPLQDASLQADTAGTLALKLKLDLTPDQARLLDNAFWKWASICEIASTETALEQLKEKKKPDAESIWFNKTQLTQAKVDISNLKTALKHQQSRAEHELQHLERRRNDIEEMLQKTDLREYSPNRKNLFRPKKWSAAGLLSAKFHTEQAYRSRIKELEKRISKKTDTIEKISRGKFSFKPTRMCLWASNVKVNFAKQDVELNPFEPRNPLKIHVFMQPEQPLLGGKGGLSSERSGNYLKTCLVDLIAYSLDSMLFGMSNSEKMLSKAKKPEKVAKWEEKLAKKQALWASKKKDVEKLIGRKLEPEENKLLDSAQQRFFKELKLPRDENYINLLQKLASQTLERDALVCLNKYPVLIRSPQLAYKRKERNPKRLKPEQWDYFIQFGYSPLLSQKQPISPKTILGIDRGVSSLMAVSIFDQSQKKFVFNKLWRENPAGLKKKERRLKNAIRNLERRIRAQSDVHLHENQMKKRLRGIENKVESLLHRASAEIVALAKQSESEIVLEALADLKQHGRKKSKYSRELNYALSLFDYAKLGQLINYKAKKQGILVYVVDSGYTSSHCNRCLLQDRKDEYKRGIEFEHNGMKRKNMKIGLCTACAESPGKPYQIDADLNAARVIALCRYKNLNNPRPFGQAFLRNK